MTTETLPRPTAPAAPRQASDDATAERLARLAARRVPTPPAGGPRPAAGAGHGGRRHAARGARAGALLMSLATTGGLTAFFAHQSAAAVPLTAATDTGSATSVLSSIDDADSTVVPSTSAATAAAATAATSATATAAATAATTATSAAATTAAAATASTGTATYTGSSVNTRYGAVQVAITVTDGSITEVKTLAAPSGGKNDRYTSMSVPVLRSEALAAQSADIDIVTGATYTSKGYISSLQSAVDQAVSAGALASA